MAQSLFALLAMILAVNFAVSVNQWYVAFQRATLKREIEEMAQSVAIETMEIIRTRAFDQAVVDGLTNGTVNDLTLFSDTTDFGTPSNLHCQAFGGTATCDDIDDFHNQRVLRPFVMGQDTVWFNVGITVEYVDYNALGEAVRATAPTAFKRVTIAVQDDWKNTLDPFLSVPIRLQRVFAYGY